MDGLKVYKDIASSVANLIIERGTERVSSGTGFVISGKLVTAGHVVNVPAGLSLTAVFEKTQPGQTARWRYPNNGNPFGGYSDENSYDYAILTPPAGTSLPPSLDWAEELPEPGEPVCALGYPFDDPHLTLHQGYVSSVYRSGVATMLKLDMSVNPSNSGGPLLRMRDGKVLGVVTRKATGLTRAFDQLVATMDENIRSLSAPRSGRVITGGIDPVQLALATQSQLRHVAAEIYRSANVGIGYAVWNRPLRNEEALDPSA